MYRRRLSIVGALVTVTFFGLVVSAQASFWDFLSSASIRSSEEKSSSEVGFVALSPSGEAGGGMIPASCESGVDVHTGLPYDSHTATYSGWSIDPTSGTPCPGGTADVGRIQGQFCIIPDGRAFSSGAVIALDSGTAPGSVQFSSPYVYNNVPSGSHAVSFIPPTGFVLTGYTMCTNSTTCHSGAITATPSTSGAVAVNVPANGYVDLWWHCQPIPPAADIKANNRDDRVLLSAGQPVDVRWTAQNAVSCEILESATDTLYPQTNVFSGTWTRNPPSLTSYGIQCVNSAWTGPSDTINIDRDEVLVGYTPSADLKVNGSNGPLVTVTQGSPIVVTFDASRVGACLIQDTATGEVRGYYTEIASLLPWAADWYSTHLFGWLGYFSLSSGEALKLVASADTQPVSGTWNRTATQGTTYSLTCISPLWQASGDSQAEVHDTVSVAVQGALGVSCTGSPNSATIGQLVTWTTSVSGSSGSVSYTWSGGSGADVVSGNAASVTKTYSTVGTKTASVLVSSGGQNATANCSISVNNNIADQCTNIAGTQNSVPVGMQRNSSGSCSCVANNAAYDTALGYCTCSDGTRRDSGSCPAAASLSASCSFLPANPQTGSNVNFQGTFSGGSGSLGSAEWYFVDGTPTTATGLSATTRYSTAGWKNVSFTVNDTAGHTVTTFCPAVVATAPDQCNNISGSQSSIPTGLQSDGSGACTCVATGATYDSAAGFCKCADGTRKDSGTCSASCSAPVGSSCVSGSNSCGTFNTGTVRSDCTCSAVTPPEPPTGCALPDLTPVGSLSAQTYAVTGSPIYTGTYYEVGRGITFDGTFRNVGAANAVIGPSYTNNIQIDSDGNLNTIEANVTSLPRPAISSLARNTSSGSRTNSAWTPIASGTYNARLCVDSPSTVNESNENNNCGAWIPLVVHPGIPDLQAVATRLVPTQPAGGYAVGTTITIETAFWNDGASAVATPPFPVRLRAQRTQPAGAPFVEQISNYTGPAVSYLPNAYQVPWAYNPFLPGVRGPSYSFTWQPTAAGTYTLTSCVDEPPYGSGIVAESNENNNCSTLANITVVNGTNQCGNGLDDDSDSTADCGGVPGYPADPGCYPDGRGGGGTCNPNDNDETDTSISPPQCGDGSDNDGDGRTDCDLGDEDPGCYPDGHGGGGACDTTDTDETNTGGGGSVCSDGIDNDSDGLSDSTDPGCFTNPNNPSTYNPSGSSESDSCAPGLGNFCTGPANSCGMTIPGRQLCDGSCSASAPSEALCSLPTITCPPGDSCTTIIPQVGGNCGISWNATPATRCVLSGNGLNEEFTPPVGSQTVSGTHTVHNVQGNKLYSITCWNGGEDTVARTFACRINPSYNPF